MVYWINFMFLFHNERDQKKVEFLAMVFPRYFQQEGIVLFILSFIFLLFIFVTTNIVSKDKISRKNTASKMGVYQSCLHELIMIGFLIMIVAGI